jgi:hypothetical protein
MTIQFWERVWQSETVRFLSYFSSSYIPSSRSEEGSPGRSELFLVRVVYRSAAKTLDGRRSGGYFRCGVQDETQQTISGYSLKFASNSD